MTVFENADDLTRYLVEQAAASAVPTNAFLNDELLEDLHDLSAVTGVVASARRQRHALRERGRLFIGNVFYETNEQDITDLFATVGIDLADVYIPHNKDGSTKSIAFVTLRNPRELDAAIAKLNGARLRGYVISVQLARAKDPSSGTVK